MALIRRNYLWTISLISILLLSSCVTQKRKEDVSALGKVYHNTTAKYNGYFNATELMAATDLALEGQYRDNYNKLLPVYLTTVNETPQALAPDMDVVVEKVTRVVGLHPQSQWADDSYLLVGQANYYKQDYEAAEKALRYLINNYDPIEIAKEEAAAKARKEKKKKTSKKKKKKKSAKKRRKEFLRAKKKRQRLRKKGKLPKETSKKDEIAAAKKAEIEAAKKAEQDFEEPDNYGIKHRPVHQEGTLWLARTLIERDNFDTALRLLNETAANPKTYPDLLPQAYQALAYYYIYRKDYGSAILPLEQAVANLKPKDGKARMAYILGQLYEKMNNGQKAYETYEQVLKYAPNYEMEFNCRLNLALNSWRANKGSATQAIAELDRLAKDIKNEEFRDQIYFAMAEIAIEQGDRTEAIALYKKSIKYNINNPQQKAESYLAVADLYYEVENYVPAQLYFDSTFQVMAKNDERYVRVQNLTENLKDIAKNILIIQEQDSLLALGTKSETELKEIAYNKLEAQQEARRLAATTSSAVTNNPNSPRITTTRVGALQNESTFFAYDDRNVKRGIREFEKRWGNRPLEDNWRRRTAITNSINNQSVDEVVEETTTAVDALTDDQLLALLEGIPRTESERAKASIQIIDAMFALGSLYRDRLENNEKAVNVLEEMNRRFPKSNYELESWYYLYLAHFELNNRAKSNQYRELILSKYSSSKYARVLLDPDYAAKLAGKEYEINLYYDEAYQALQAGNHEKAQNMALEAKLKFGADNPLRARFDLLYALTVGKSEGEQAYKNALTQVVTKHPDTDEQRTAREILRILGGGNTRLPGVKDQDVQANFKLDDNQVHFVLVAYEGEVNLNAAKANLSDYNKKFHRAQRLTISNVFLGADPQNRTPMLIVRRFNNRAAAMKYYDSANKNRGEFQKQASTYDLFAISLSNYREILQAKSLDGYRNYFENNYLGE